MQEIAELVQKTSAPFNKKEFKTSDELARQAKNLDIELRTLFINCKSEGRSFDIQNYWQAAAQALAPCSAALSKLVYLCNNAVNQREFQPGTPRSSKTEKKNPGNTQSRPMPAAPGNTAPSPAPARPPLENPVSPTPGRTAQGEFYTAAMLSPPPPPNWQVTSPGLQSPFLAHNLATSKPYLRSGPPPSDPPPPLPAGIWLRNVAPPSSAPPPLPAGTVGMLSPASALSGSASRIDMADSVDQRAGSAIAAALRSAQAPVPAQRGGLKRAAPEQLTPESAKARHTLHHHSPGGLRQSIVNSELGQRWPQHHTVPAADAEPMTAIGDNAPGSSFMYLEQDAVATFAVSLQAGGVNETVENGGGQAVLPEPAVDMALEEKTGVAQAVIEPVPPPYDVAERWPPADTAAVNAIQTAIEHAPVSDLSSAALANIQVQDDPIRDGEPSDAGVGNALAVIAGNRPPAEVRPGEGALSTGL